MSYFKKLMSFITNKETHTKISNIIRKISLSIDNISNQRKILIVFIVFLFTFVLIMSTIDAMESWMPFYKSVKKYTTGQYYSWDREIQYAPTLIASLLSAAIAAFVLFKSKK